MENKRPLPEAFIVNMRQSLGQEEAEKLFEALSGNPVTSIRLNPAKWAVCTKQEPSPPYERVPQYTLESDGNAHSGPCLPYERVPWCDTGYYLEGRPAFTFDPILHAGAYYVQEASSMFIEQLIKRFACDLLSSTPHPKHSIIPTQKPFDCDLLSPTPICKSSASPTVHVPASQMVLDLCAAPGGKSTLLRSLLSDNTLLVCNEPVAKRAQILSENITKWGDPNVVITQNFPEAFASLYNMFDVILTDVPCSGEGMFRKDDTSIAEWSPENVAMCQRRQRAILTSVWPSLKLGGLLIYSTCTFNHLEDEDNVKWIAETLGADILKLSTHQIPATTLPNSDHYPTVFHFYPHRTKGEGFFVAALRKQTLPIASRQSPVTTPPTEVSATTQAAPIASSAKPVPYSIPKTDILAQPTPGNPKAIGTALHTDHMLVDQQSYSIEMQRDGTLFAIPNRHAAPLQQLHLFTNIIQKGIELGRYDERKKTFVPSQALALSTALNQNTFPHAELSHAQAISYLRGESLTLPPDIPKGYVIVRFRSLPLGFVKNIGQRANNLYPAHWRIKSTHTTPFTL